MNPPTAPVSAEAVAAVRSFNRFYTGVVGLLDAGLLRSPYTLTEARVLFELAQQDAAEVAGVRRAMDIDAGHLSRILARFEADQLITRTRSGTDARRQLVSLTRTGRAAFRMLDKRSSAEARTLLTALPEDARTRLLAAMGNIRAALTATPRDATVTIRPPAAGDLGWIVERNGALYASEYGWDASYEALVLGIVGAFAAEHDPLREAAWIADVDGTPAGGVLCVAEDTTTARLRLLLVEPWARGSGVGGRLIETCLAFAADAGYSAIVLWTNDPLASARRLYERAGFTLTTEEPHHSFGHDMVGQTWRREL